MSDDPGPSNAARANANSPSVKRILREIRELAESAREDETFVAEPSEDDIFDWHFALFGPPGTPFERGIYHGRIVLPPEYPFKPPSFVLLTPNGRFETNTKICLSISQHHPKQWQPSWSIRAALTAIRAFFPTPPEGAVGSLDWSDDVRRELAERSWRAREPTFTHGNEARRALSASVHNRMLERMERVMRKELGNEAREDAERSDEAETTVREADAREEDGNVEARDDDANAPETSRAANDASESPSLATPAPVVDVDETIETQPTRDGERDDVDVARGDEDEDPPRPVTPVDATERRARVAARAEELAKTKSQLDVTAWSLVAAIVAILVKRVIVHSIIVALES